jgi:hypothetical protein
MAWLFRANILLVIVVGLAGVAAALMFWPSGQLGLAVPRPLKSGDQEIVWLREATNTGWERFVAAVRRLHADRPDLELDDVNAFPGHTTAVPELSIRAEGQKSHLWFRWYKLTGDQGTAQWVQALAKRDPPPLAIIGGGTTDRALDLARELANLSLPVESRPLLLITTATADQVYLEDTKVDLMKVYPERSFRFCFTNRQMTEALTDFIWQQKDLRPEEPAYLVYWKDDPYSEDLSEHFKEVLRNPPYGLSRPWSIGIPYSLGGFTQPNLWEADAIELLMNELSTHPSQRRSLLVLPATPQSARRFLRGLERTAPLEVGKFVVATGDGIDLNIIYRDRRLSWPIQDLPFTLVLFCHRNPVDPIAFQPDLPDSEPTASPAAEKSNTSTHDLLLYRDTVSLIVDAACRKTGVPANPERMKTHLREAQLPDGRQRFDQEGNQRSGAGEFVVVLHPVRQASRVLPRAKLEVWNRSVDAGDGRRWRQIRELEVDYLPHSPVSVPEGAP